MGVFRACGPWQRLASSLHRPIIACALVLLAPATLRADWYFSPFIGVKFGGDTTLVQPEPNAASRSRLTYGGSVMWLGNGLFGVEADFGIVPDYFSGDLINGNTDPGKPPQYTTQVQSSRLTTLMGNAVLAAPLSWTGYSLRPYISGGAGLVRARRTDALGGFTTATNLNGFNLGGGAIGFVRPHVGVKWDLRYIRGWGPSDRGDCFGGCRMHLWRANMALVLKY
jgi:hypothetical protein